MSDLIHFVLNLNTTLPEFVGAHGWLIYPLLFLIIFLETGIVITPFLPGDSIIFAAAALAAMGMLSLPMLIGLLMVAAILGNMTNYFIGKALSDVLEDENKLRFIKRKYIQDAQGFFDRYGKLAIVITRFIPIVRTFIPFISGVGRMKWRVFMAYNCIGGVLWVALFSFLGYMFGNIPIVQKYYDIVIIAIVCISLVPIVITALMSRAKKRRALKAGDGSEETAAENSKTEESTK